ncbi:hypothetical protein K2173_011908 [Erythroxylum novogranatense]|uniref:Transmembrane protein n=1 Tax=Erythroxylum novogranatense TaxID=1862640 RepID=A0AAV8TGX3_9ROSI|nr:hypothetical protein K2173_011908 [Erythroxylum novogranatense]
MLQCHLQPLTLTLTFTTPHHILLPSLQHHSHSLLFHQRPITHFSLSALPPQSSLPWLTVADDSPGETGPIELPLSSSPTIFSTTDDPSPLQVTTSVLLTAAISIFLFRSIRRRAKRAKELRLRSSGENKSLKEEALASLTAMAPGAIASEKTPSPVQALLGGISAGVIALILYKFTTTIEASLNRQALSDNYSVRQITITVRTIVNGLCYLATCVFGVNSVGLFLYSAQLAINSLTKGENSEEQGTRQSTSPNSTSESPAAGATSSDSQGDRNPDDRQ